MLLRLVMGGGAAGEWQEEKALEWDYLRNPASTPDGPTAAHAASGNGQPLVPTTL